MTEERGFEMEFWGAGRAKLPFQVIVTRFGHKFRSKTLPIRCFTTEFHLRVTPQRFSMSGSKNQCRLCSLYREDEHRHPLHFLAAVYMYHWRYNYAILLPYRE